MAMMRRLALLLVLFPAVGCSEESSVFDDVGEAEFCESVAKWTGEASNAEAVLLDAVNEARRVGATCGEDIVPPALPVELSPELRCASRIHARDQSGTGMVSHEGSDGSNTLERIGLAGYEDFPRHELLAGDFTDGRDVVDAWLDDPEHCVALLDNSIEHAGPGAHESSQGDSIVWVLTTGEPRPE
jgi:uncharacterized protein YkwD